MTIIRLSRNRSGTEFAVRRSMEWASAGLRGASEHNAPPVFKR
jgi:hypothetical protein